MKSKISFHAITFLIAFFGAFLCALDVITNTGDITRYSDLNTVGVIGFWMLIGVISMYAVLLCVIICLFIYESVRKISNK